MSFLPDGTKKLVKAAFKKVSRPKHKEEIIHTGSNVEIDADWDDESDVDLEEQRKKAIKDVASGIIERVLALEEQSDEIFDIVSKTFQLHPSNPLMVKKFQTFSDFENAVNGMYTNMRVAGDLDPHLKQLVDKVCIKPLKFVDDQSEAGFDEMVMLNSKLRRVYEADGKKDIESISNLVRAGLTPKALLKHHMSRCFHYVERRVYEYVPLEVREENDVTNIDSLWTQDIIFRQFMASQTSKPESYSKSTKEVVHNEVTRYRKPSQDMAKTAAEYMAKAILEGKIPAPRIGWSTYSKASRMDLAIEMIDKFAGWDWRAFLKAKWRAEAKNDAPGFLVKCMLNRLPRFNPLKDKSEIHLIESMPEFRRFRETTTSHGTTEVIGRDSEPEERRDTTTPHLKKAAPVPSVGPGNHSADLPANASRQKSGRPQEGHGLHTTHPIKQRLPNNAESGTKTPDPEVPAIFVTHSDDYEKVPLKRPNTPIPG